MSDTAEPRRGGDAATFRFFHERPGDAPMPDDLWLYTDRQSYAPGDEVVLHGIGGATTFLLDVARDGGTPCPPLIESTSVAVRWASTPTDAYAKGCGWPELLRFRIPRDTPSGFYVVTGRIGDRRAHHGLAVRAGAARARALLVLCTSTWNAYNDFGGGNHYEQVGATADDPFAARLSTLRPWSRGFVRLPTGAPRKTAPAPHVIGQVPRYAFDWAYANGFGKYSGAAGWAQYERHFAHWAERAGYRLDYATQGDLHRDPARLDGYACVVMVGHDEYWSWEMRDAVDAFVDRGGRFARFGGNITWQIRIEDDGGTQLCHKYLAPKCDAAAGNRMTGPWDLPAIGRPAASTFGVSGAQGGYVKVGAVMPRASGGYTVHRPEHWAFSGTDVYWGDVLGADANVFAYEVDGLSYTVERGMPMPTRKSGAPEGLEILAMGLASWREVDNGHGARLYLGDSDAAFRAEMAFGRVDEETMRRASPGAGMMVSFRKSAGEVFNVGSCEWVCGLTGRDPQIERITRNVLDRFGA